MKACCSDFYVACVVFINMSETYMNNVHITSEGPARIEDGGELHFLLTACLPVFSLFDFPICWFSAIPIHCILTLEGVRVPAPPWAIPGNLEVVSGDSYSPPFNITIFLREIYIWFGNQLQFQENIRPSLEAGKLEIFRNLPRQSWQS